MIRTTARVLRWAMLASTLMLAACGQDSMNAAPTTSGESVPPPSPSSVAFSASNYSTGQSAGSVTVMVVRTGTTGAAITMDYATSDGTAVAGSDYSPTSGTLQWDENDSAPKSVSIPISTATAFTGDKSFDIVLSNPSASAQIGSPGTATVTISGMATASVGALQLSDAAYPVAQAGKTVTVTVDRTGGSFGATTVAYATANGTAIAGQDYTETSGTLQWADGDSAAKTFMVPVSDATPFSGNRTFTVALSDATAGATIGAPGSATITIAGNASPPVGSLQLGAAGYSIAQTGANLQVTVKRTGGSNGAVSVSYSTTSGTAIAGKDFTAASGKLAWADGDAADKSFSVAISNATPFTGNKTFTVGLTKPSAGANIGSPGSATVVIAGSAAPAIGSLQLSASSYAVGQGGGKLTVTVSRTAGSSGAVGVAYSTVNGTAVGGTDFTATNGTLSWADGDSASKTFSVAVSNATPFSGTRSFTVKLSSATGGAALGSPSSATATITGDGAAPTPGKLELSSSSYSVGQAAGTLSVSVTRTGGSSGAVTTAFATSNGTAKSGTDYTAASGTLSWAAGDAATKSFSVSVSNATPFTGSKSFSITLSGVSGGATLGTPSTATASITGDAAPESSLQLSAASDSVAQSAGTVSVTVTRTGSSGAVSIDYATANGTALSGTDYTATSGTLNWVAGDAASKSFSVAISKTTPFSGNKSFTVALSNAVSATIGTPNSASVMIVGSGTAPPAGVFGIAVSGNKFVSTLTGKAVEIVGTNISGLENGGYNSQWTQFKTAGSAFWSKVVNWGGSGINAVRLPLNEASWLNYTCYDSGSGASGDLYPSASGGGYTPDPQSIYQAAVKQAVADATAAGLYVILDLHWGAPNSASGQPYCPIGQPGYADNDHSVTFWKQLADAFKGNPAVVFELFNEPFGTNTYGNWVNQNGNTYTPGPEATMLFTGGNFKPFDAQNNPNGNSMFTVNITWNAASMVTLLKTIRAEGATNVVLASPIGWAGEIETWLGTYSGSGNPDPLKQFGVAWHLYGYAKGTAPPLAVLSAGYPILVTETYGFDAAVDGGQNANGYTWAASQGIGYMWWGWNDWDGGPLSENLNQPPWYLSTPP